MAGARGAGPLSAEHEGQEGLSDLLTIEQCALKAGVSVSTIKREIHDGRLKSTDGGVLAEDWDSYLLDRRVQRMTPAEKRRVVEYVCLPSNAEQEAKLTAESIRANRAPFPFSGPAVYFLWKGEELIYIGQAVNLFARVAVHLRDKEFDSFSYVSCKLEELSELERRAILLWQPTLNKMFVYKE
jgi:hypothetical protein